MSKTKIADISFYPKSNAGEQVFWIKLPHDLELDNGSVVPISSSSTLFVTNTESGAVAHNNYNLEISYGKAGTMH
jgi:hypothetical protein